MKVLKSAIFTLISAAAISCAANESVNKTAAEAVSFDSFIHNITKATSKSAFAVGDIFYVDAYYTGTTEFASATPEKFMQDQSVELSGSEASSTWGYAPIRYWPADSDEKISFFAVSGASSFDDLGSGNAVSFTLDSASDDLLVASLIDQTQPTSGGLTLNFAHVMSHVIFNIGLAEALAAETVVTLTKFTVEYPSADGALVPDGGTFTFNNAYVYGSTDSAKAVIGSWAPNTTARATDDLTPDAANSIITANSQELATLMIIPTAQEPTVTMKYTVTTTDSNSALNSSTITNTVSFPITPALINTKYTYNISISLNAVVVDAVTDSAYSWADTNNSTALVPDEDSGE